eukprot:954256_1
MNPKTMSRCTTLAAPNGDYFIIVVMRRIVASVIIIRIRSYSRSSIDEIVPYPTANVHYRIETGCSSWQDGMIQWFIPTPAAGIIDNLDVALAQKLRQRVVCQSSVQRLIIEVVCHGINDPKITQIRMCHGKSRRFTTDE